MHFAQCGVSAPQLVGKSPVVSLQKTRLWDPLEKLIKRFYDSYANFARKTNIGRNIYRPSEVEPTNTIGFWMCSGITRVVLEIDG